MQLHIVLDGVPISHDDGEGIRCGLRQITLATGFCACLWQQTAVTWLNEPDVKDLLDKAVVGSYLIDSDWCVLDADNVHWH